MVPKSSICASRKPLLADGACYCSGASVWIMNPPCRPRKKNLDHVQLFRTQNQRSKIQSSRVVYVGEVVREGAVGKYLQKVVLQVLDVVFHYEFKREGAVVVDGDRIGEQYCVSVFDAMCNNITHFTFYVRFDFLNYRFASQFFLTGFS